MIDKSPKLLFCGVNSLLLTFCLGRDVPGIHGRGEKESWHCRLASLDATAYCNLCFRLEQPAQEALYYLLQKKVPLRLSRRRYRMGM